MWSPVLLTTVVAGGLSRDRQGKAAKEKRSAGNPYSSGATQAHTRLSDTTRSANLRTPTSLRLASDRFGVWPPGLVEIPYARCLLLSRGLGGQQVLCGAIAQLLRNRHAPCSPKRRRRVTRHDALSRAAKHGCSLRSA